MQLSDSILGALFIKKHQIWNLFAFEFFGKLLATIHKELVLYLNFLMSTDKWCLTRINDVIFRVEVPACVQSIFEIVFASFSVECTIGRWLTCYHSLHCEILTIIVIDTEVLTLLHCFTRYNSIVDKQIGAFTPWFFSSYKLLDPLTVWLIITSFVSLTSGFVCDCCTSISDGLWILLRWLMSTRVWFFWWNTRYAVEHIPKDVVVWGTITMSHKALTILGSVTPTQTKDGTFL